MGPFVPVSGWRGLVGGFGDVGCVCDACEGCYGAG